jgi:hypothetical protein
MPVWQRAEIQEVLYQREREMRLIATILILLFASVATADLQSGSTPTGPENLRLTGPVEVLPGETVTVIVHGLPAVDLALPIGEQTAWIETLRIVLDTPGAAIDVDKELSMTVAPWGWRLRVSWTADEPGVYLLVCDWNQEPFGLALHRVTIRGPPPTPPVPPDPPTPPTPTPGTLTGAAYLIVVRPEQPTADQAQDLLDLRVWVDSQPAGKAEMLDVTRDQASSDGVEGRLRPYIERVPSGEPLPYVFLVRQRTAGGSHVFQEGRLAGDAADWIAKVQEVMP